MKGGPELTGKNRWSLGSAVGISVGCLIVCALAALWLARNLEPGDENATASQPIEAEASARHPGETIRAQLIKGGTYAEIDQWDKAVEVFEQVAAREPEEPSAIFNLAVAHFRKGEREKALAYLTQLPSGLPPRLAGRIQFLRGKLAYEEGNLEAELAAYLRAHELDPEEVGYLFTLAELGKRLPQEDAAMRGSWLEKAYQRWPDNTRLGSDFAAWALAQGDAKVRERGLTVLEKLVAESSKGEIHAYLEKGRQDLARSESAGSIPIPLRVTLNLLLATKPFQSSSAVLEDRLQIKPVDQPVGKQQVKPPLPPLEIHLTETTTVLPKPSLEPGERVVGVVLVDDAVDAPHGAYREATLALLSDRALYLLPRSGKAWQKLTELAKGARQILAGELTDDNKMELIVLAAKGIRLWQRPEQEQGDKQDEAPWQELSYAPELANAGAFSQAALLDFEHDGDLDLLALDSAGRLTLITHRGEAGWGTPQTAPLPVNSNVRCLVATDLDGDSDQDLILGTDDALVALRNWRQGEFSLHRRYPLLTPPDQIRALHYTGEKGLADLVVLSNANLSFWSASEGGILQNDPRNAGTLAALPKEWSPSQVAVADFDLDGDQDLLVSGEGLQPSIPEFHLVRNSGHVQLEWVPEAVTIAETAESQTEVALRGLLPVDLDGDHDSDLLFWSGDRLGVLRNAGAEKQNWLALRLRGLNRKVPLDARGVRVQVAFGDRMQWLDPQRPNIIIGLGQDGPAVIKATWPNGISEYLFEPQANTTTTLTLSMRVEGSCPFLYAADGQEMRFITDILGLSPLGMLVAPGHYVRPDPEEYLRLPDWLRAQDGIVELRITEELREVTYLDQVELVAVDAGQDVVAYNGERWLPFPVEGLDLRLLTPFEAPLSVLDHRGAEVLETVRYQDHRYLTNHTQIRRYQGAVEPHHLIVEFPPHLASTEHPTLVLIGWLHWGNTSTNLARSQDPDGAPLFPIVEIPDGEGGWQSVPTAVGLPAGKTKPVVVDLTDVLDRLDPRVRLTTDFEVYWDQIAIAQQRRASVVPHRIHRLRPDSAELRYGGFSRWYRPAANGPYLFDYSDRRPYPWRLDRAGREVPLSWQELAGYYTEFGRVTSLLEQADDRLVVFGSGEELVLTFDTRSLPSLPGGWQRTWFLHSEGWEKDGDPNVACSQTVEPLPHRDSVEEPCSGVVEEARAISEEAFRSRWVSADRLARRVPSAINFNQ